MRTRTRKLAVGDAGVSSPAIQEAAEILASGGLVAFPTETVYGIGANADDPAAMERLVALKQRPPEKPFSFHIADRKDLRKHVRRVPVTGRKLMKAFWPGPLTLVFGRTRRAVGVRLPAHEVARAFLRAAGVPVVAPSANPAGEEPASSAAEVIERLNGQVDAVLDGGDAPLRQPSTVVRVWRSGWELLREGIISRAMVERALRTNVLFVCTGNSCRSPIAEALCRRVLARHLGVEERDLAALGYDVSSAGTAAIGGSPASRSAVAAAREAGLDISGHCTRPLTRELLLHADRVFAMSRTHANAARELCPEAADKIELLDPDGGDIADPIGYPPSEFARVVRRMERCLERRVKEL